MSSKPSSTLTPAELRRQAEARLRKRPSQKPGRQSRNSESAAHRLLHELQIHQVELEMQNEELSRAKVQAEATAGKFSDLYDFAPIGYVSLDTRGFIQELNLTAAKLLSRVRTEVTGTPFAGYVAQPDRDTYLRHLQTSSATDQKVIREVGLQCSEGGRVLPVQLCTTFHRDGSGQMPHYRMVISDITERKQAEEELRQLNAELEERVRKRTATIRTLATELTLVEQREKSRLSHVLHEGLQQLLLGAKFLLNTVREDFPESGASRLGRVEEILSQAVEAARTLAVELSPPILQSEGLGESLKWLGRWMLEKHGLTVEVTVGPRPAPLSVEVSVLLYQAVRELLFNVVKHAQVKSARVDMAWRGAEVDIVVSDEGKGFAPVTLETARSSAGKFGLFSVRERLALLGGAVAIDSAPGQGSRFTLRAPLGPPATPRTRGRKRKIP